tara:strand:- start:1040 stop:1744 length:705 start_codon:yes stop_codon:yes gene_type:complete
MSITKKLKWKRALSTLRFSYDELDYVKEASKAAAQEFEAYYRKYCAENGINISQLDRQHKDNLDKLYGRNEITDGNADKQPQIQSAGETAIVIHDQVPLGNDEEYQMTADDIAMHDAFSKLFKQIALKLHPDRIDKSLPDDEQKLRISMFQNANQAFEDKKYYILLDVAEKYNITTPKNYNQQTRWMKKETTMLQQMIANQKNTYNYCFAETETDQEKDMLIKKFLQQLFRINV